MIGKCFSFAAGAIAFALLTASASAAPIRNLNTIATDSNPTIEKVHYGRRCWWHHGHWHCRM